MLSQKNNVWPTLTPAGDWRSLNESIWMIGGWVHQVCSRYQRRRSHIYATLTNIYTMHD